MIIKPRIRGFICTTAHPGGCSAHVHEQVNTVQSMGSLSSNSSAPKRVLILGCSGGYGLASRITAAFACHASTLGVSFEKPPTSSKTATAGWYNNRAFEDAAISEGLYAKTIEADAFADETRDSVIETIKTDMGSIDMLIYSLASPVREHPRTGNVHRSVIKPLGDALNMKSVNMDKGEVFEINLDAASEEETLNTVAVMGGEDWEFWIDALQKADVLSKGFRTLAFTYIGTELTWPIYWEGTLGKAKEDLDRASRDISSRLDTLGGEAKVVVLKAVVTQAMSAIPVVPLYASLLFRVMKDKSLHENTILHIYRMFETHLCVENPRHLDEQGRMRMDDLEMLDEVQNLVKQRWNQVNSQNLAELADLSGYRADFLRIFGFGIDGVDYEADVDPTLADG